MFEIRDPRPLPNIERGLDPIVALQEINIVDHTGAFRPAALGQRRARAAHGRDRFVSQALAQLALGRRGVFLRAFKMPCDLVEFTPLPIQNHDSLTCSFGVPTK
jgi:hypothetical protein